MPIVTQGSGRGDGREEAMDDDDSLGECANNGRSMWLSIQRTYTLILVLLFVGKSGADLFEIFVVALC